MSLKYFGNELYNRGPNTVIAFSFRDCAGFLLVYMLFYNTLCSMSWFLDFILCRIVPSTYGTIFDVFCAALSHLYMTRYVVYFVPYCPIYIWHDMWCILCRIAPSIYDTICGVFCAVLSHLYMAQYVLYFVLHCPFCIWHDMWCILCRIVPSIYGPILLLLLLLKKNCNARLGERD